jgi:hypothetical protein
MLPSRYDVTLPHNQRKLDIVTELSGLADKAGITLVEMAVAFVLEHPAISSAIIGPRTMEQLETQLAAPDVVLGAETLDAIDALVPPGSNVAPGEVGYAPPALTDVKLRRRSASNVTVLIDEHDRVAVAETGEILAEGLVLPGPQFEEEGTPDAKEAWTLRHDATQDIGAIGATVVKPRGLERKGVALKEGQRRGGYIGHDTDDNIDAARQHGRKRGEQVAPIDLDAVRSGTPDGNGVEITGHHRRPGMGDSQGAGDRPRTRAKIYGDAGGRETRNGAPRQALAVPPWYVDTRVHPEVEPTKGHPPGDPGQGLPRAPAGHERPEKVDVPACTRQELDGLLFGGDEPLLRQQRGEVPGVGGHPPRRQPPAPIVLAP